jgi:hypothetical protein
LNKTHSYRLGRDLYPAEPTVNNRPHLLDIGFEFPLGLSGNLPADPTKILGLTSPGDTPAGSRVFASKIAHSRHIEYLCLSAGWRCRSRPEHSQSPDTKHRIIQLPGKIASPNTVISKKSRFQPKTTLRLNRRRRI